MSKASDNIFPKLITGMQTSDTAAPSDSSWKIYSKADGIYARSSNSIVGPLTGVGDIATDALWDAAGDLAVGTGANTAAKLTVGASGKVPASNGTTLAYVYPPGYEFDYAQLTSGAVSITATTEATANTIVTGNAVSYDGSTVVMVEFYSPAARPDLAAANRNIQYILYDSVAAASVGIIGLTSTPAAAGNNVPTMCRYRITPSNASHTYSIRAFVSAGTGLVGNSTGGAGAQVPTYIRITKV